MSRTEPQLLSDALLHMGYIERYADMDLAEDVVVDAIALRLSSMLDVLARLPEDSLEEMFGAVWPAMRGLRNRIAHGYHLVDLGVLRVTVAQELPLVREAVEARLLRFDATLDVDLGWISAGSTEDLGPIR